MRRKIKGKRKWPYIIAITVVTALCITTATEWSMVLTQPMQIQNDNQVSGNLTTSFSYQPIESPNPLLPKGGATTGNGTIFTAITRQLVIHEQMNFLANQPMTLHLSSTPIIRLIAPNMWEKDYPVASTQTIVTHEKSGTLWNETYTINLATINEFTSNMTKALQISPDSYTITLDPQIAGEVTYNRQTEQIPTVSGLSFQENGQELEVQSSLTNSIPVSFTLSSITPNTCHLFGWTLPIPLARTGLGSLFGILLVALLILLWPYRKLRVGIGSKPSERLEKRHRDRIFHLSQTVNFGHSFVITLDSLASLVRLALDRDVPILRECTGDAALRYVAIDGDCAYVYTEDEGGNVHTKQSSFPLDFGGIRTNEPNLE